MTALLDPVGEFIAAVTAGAHDDIDTLTAILATLDPATAARLGVLACSVFLAEQARDTGQSLEEVTVAFAEDIRHAEEAAGFV